MTEPCRRCFHGVPLIIEDTLPSYLSPDKDHDEEDWEIYGRYMLTSRINLNLRQVYPLEVNQGGEEKS
ncbi:hypothetical protein BDA99DRAFT_528160 [Phascolomyces articulosus]|uniref:Uncharacterized protein n=1 Tax=Phascolomyces articulosus TaxID=60185 RepID=A0AAD5JM86_9FUNG|nr:hypothetical protein BDA99DRAFT_528160 [Phascolomyces articulosus]